MESAENDEVDIDTAALFGASQSGDESAIDTLLRRYLPGLVAYVRNNAGNGIVAHESVTDIAQSACREVLTRLTEERFTYTDEAHFRAWLYQVASRKIKDRARHWTREKRNPGRLRMPESDETVLLDGIAAALTPSEHAIGREQRARLAVALEKLDPRQREIVKMAYEEQLPHKEIAARLQIEEGHSRTLLARALARLARLLAE